VSSDGIIGFEGEHPIHPVSPASCLYFNAFADARSLVACIPRHVPRRLQVSQGGKLLDEVATPFGIGSLTWSVEQGLLLNGKSIKINFRAACPTLDTATKQQARLEVSRMLEWSLTESLRPDGSTITPP
jgi:hypothetical protein